MPSFQLRNVGMKNSNAVDIRMDLHMYTEGICKVASGYMEI